MTTSLVLLAAIFIFVVFIFASSVLTVDQNEEYLIERFGKYSRTLKAGLNFKIPFIESVREKVNRQSQTIDVPAQSVITKDNITLTVDGVLFIKIVNSYDAVYGIDHRNFALTQLGQTIMRSEIGKLELDGTFEAREQLNANIVQQITEASAAWGVQVTRYEIKDITPPVAIKDSMEKQMKAEREKRAVILESEGEKEAAINKAQGDKAARVLDAEAEKQEQVLKAEGLAESLIKEAEGRAKALELVGRASSTDEGKNAVQFELAQNALTTQSQIAKESTLIMLPSSDMSPASLVAQAMGVAQKIAEAK